MSARRGFTLLEILVVIAIIGFLASIAMVSLNSARTKARTKAVYGSLKNIQSGALLCLNGGGNLTRSGGTCTGGVSTPNEGQPLCTDTTILSDIWPVLPTGFDYRNGCSSNAGTGDFSFRAWDNAACTITCTDEGCMATVGC